MIPAVLLKLLEGRAKEVLPDLLAGLHEPAVQAELDKVLRTLAHHIAAELAALTQER